MQGIIETTQATVRIVPAGDLLCVYPPGRQEPQACYIALDVRDGDFWAAYNPEVGNAVPMAVWHGIVCRWRIPVLQAATATALLQELAPLAQQVLDGAVVVWDGSNHVGRLDASAEAAEDAIIARCEEVEPDCHWAGAGDWLAQDRPDIIARLRGGETVEALMAELDGDGTDEDRPVLVGLYEYIEGLRDEA